MHDKPQYLAVQLKSTACAVPVSPAFVAPGARAQTTPHLLKRHECRAGYRGGLKGETPPGYDFSTPVNNDTQDSGSVFKPAVESQAGQASKENER